MYEVSLNVYEGSKNDKKCKGIMVDDREIYLFIGASVGINDLPNTLSISAEYADGSSEEITENIEELKDFGTYIAINPNFRDKKLINKLKDLFIFSDTVDVVKKEEKDYEIVEVNTDVLKKYNFFGDSILEDFKKSKDDLIV